MACAKQETEKKAIDACLDALRQGRLSPWKVEEEAAKCGVVPPHNYRTAALCRQKYIEEQTGEEFREIRVTEKPFRQFFRCHEDQLTWELDALDIDQCCTLCGSVLEPLDGHGPLVANYVGGREAYYSYSGRIRVHGDIQKTFTNLLVYGTGLGPLGVTRGSFLVNKFGGAEVSVSELGRAARCLCYAFSSEAAQIRAARAIEAYLSELKPAMEDKLAEFRGKLGPVEYLPARTRNGFILYIDFTAEFSDFRGHGLLSQAVGLAKMKIDSYLKSAEISYTQSVIAQGYDGDLKPSPRNKRGRSVSARIRIPEKDFEEELKLDPHRFLSFVEIDRQGAQKLGCQFYSGMGGEIIPAIYKATRVNPHSSLVTCFQFIHTRLEKGDLVYEVELPNLEVGVTSSKEGLIPPVGREALRIMGICTAKEFAAAVAAQVLAGEFNLALEISRERLYTSFKSS